VALIAFNFSHHEFASRYSLFKRRMAVAQLIS